MPHKTSDIGPHALNSNPPRKDNRIIDIQNHDGAEYLLQEIKDTLKTPAGSQGPRRIPSMLLWDQEGLKRFEDITYLDEYYLTQTEIGILERSSDVIARKIKPGSMLIELGSGLVVLLLQFFHLVIK